MKVLIVGAGPIGCYTAQLIKRKSKAHEVHLIEEHAEIGRPVHCAGLVSKDVFSEMKVGIDNATVINRIDGAEFFLDGKSFSIRRQDVACVIDRAQFDAALGEGLHVDFNTKFVGIEQHNGGFLIETDKGEFYADVLIGADGANSSVRKVGAFREDIEFLRGVQFRIRQRIGGHNFVRVYLRKPFFAWVIPESAEIVRVGIISRSPYHDLAEFLKEVRIDGEIIEKFGGLVPLGECQSQQGNVILVGDAACQVKPLTHGGIYYGMRCAEVLADCLCTDTLHEYEKRWRQKFNKEIRIGLKVRRIFERLSFNAMEEVFCLFREHADILEQYGDFENHSKVISALVKNPRLQTLFGKILINIIKDV